MNAKTVLMIVPLLIAALAIGFAANPPGPVLAAGHCDSCQDCCPTECPCCRCVSKVEEVELKKDCYCIETVKICIPKVTLPFPFCGGCKTCKGNCNCFACPDAKCKTVKVLVKKKYKCKECKCVWTPVSCGGNCDDGCAATVPGIITDGKSCDCD